MVSNSRLNTWKTNHYDHYQKYVNKLQRKQKSSPLIRGSIIHECLEAYYSGKSWIKVLDKFEKDFYENTFSEEREELGDIPGLARELLENYFVYYEEEDEETEYLHNELHFQLPLVEGIEIQGYIDAIIKDKNGKIWVVDYKTYSRMKDRGFFLYNTQSAIYIWAMQEMGYEVEGVIWDVLKAKMPGKPKFTKTGKLSKAKMDSTPYTVEKGLIEIGEDPEEHREYIDSFEFESFFQRNKIRLNQSSVEFMMEDVIATAQQIKEYGETWKDFNLQTMFPSSYRELWEAEMLGADTDFIIDDLFEERKRFNVENEEEKK